MAELEPRLRPLVQEVAGPRMDRWETRTSLVEKTSFALACEIEKRVEESEDALGRSVDLFQTQARVLRPVRACW